MALEEDEKELIAEAFASRSEGCEGCPFFIEYAERLTWLHPEAEGMVMCALLGGAAGEISDCKLINQQNEEEDNDAQDDDL